MLREGRGEAAVRALRPPSWAGACPCQHNKEEPPTPPSPQIPQKPWLAWAGPAREVPANGWELIGSSLAVRLSGRNRPTHPGDQATAEPHQGLQQHPSLLLGKRAGQGRAPPVWEGLPSAPPSLAGSCRCGGGGCC